MKIKNDLNRYYREIKRNLPCPRKIRKTFLAEAYKLVNDFMENQPDATYDDIVKSVGTPEELAATFLSTLMDGEKIEKYHQKRRKRKFFLVALVSLFIITLIGIIIYIGQARYHTVVTEETTTVIDSVSSS